MSEYNKLPGKQINSKQIRHWVTFTLLSVCLFFTSGCGPGCEGKNPSAECKEGFSESSFQKVTIELTYHDFQGEEQEASMIAELYAHLAPQTVARITALMREGFYDGLYFHRVIRPDNEAGTNANFVQIGDPDCFDPQSDSCDGVGGSNGANLPPEYSSTEYVAGTMAMASATDSNGEPIINSQFFICTNDSGCSSLTGEYTIFGKVIAGLSVLKLIVEREDRIINIIVQ